MAVTLVRAVSGLAFEFEDGSVFKPEAQVGLHTGDVAGGTLGLKRKLMCMVGDAMVSRRRGWSGLQLW